MNDLQTKRVAFFGFILFSVFLVFTILGPIGFPYAAFSICFLLSALLIYWLLPTKSIYSQLLFMLILLLSVCLLWRANGFITFLNCLAIFFLGAIMIEYPRKPHFGFLRAVLTPIEVFFQTLSAGNAYTMKTLWPEHEEPQNRRLHAVSPEIIKGILLTVVVLAVIIPLLSYANPFFGHLVTSVLNVVNLADFVTKYFLKPITVVRFVVFILLCLLLPRLATYIKKELTQHDALPMPHATSRHLLIPKVAVAIVLAIFFVTQLQLYFADPHTLANLGYTNSKLTREVFGQLSVVIFVVFLLLYNDRRKSSLGKMTEIILTIQAIFLVFVAAKSDYDYMHQFGYTYLRLYGVAGIVWLSGMMLLWVVDRSHHFSMSTFTKSAVVLTAGLLFLVNVINFDQLIYYGAKATTGQGVDEVYLSQLSPDAYSYHDQLVRLMNRLSTTSRQSDPQFDNELSAAQTLLYQIQSLQDKYHHLDIRTFNYNEYRQWQATRMLPLANYQAILDAKLSGTQ